MACHGGLIECVLIVRTLKAFNLWRETEGLILSSKRKVFEFFFLVVFKFLKVNDLNKSYLAFKKKCCLEFYRFMNIKP